MANLFIIGNGFDISHGLATSYQNFHDYLIENYPNASPDQAFSVPCPITMPNGSEEYNITEVVSIIMKLFNDIEGDNWSNLEYSMGYLDYDDFLEILNPDDEDENEWHIAYDNQDVSSNLLDSILMITELFDDWIRTISISKNVVLKKDFKNLLNQHQDFFLTFNYTLTLEKIYGVKNICHIHGKQGEKLHFGHGNTKDYYDDYLDTYPGAEDALNQLHNNLRKNTNQIFENNISFFNNLSDISKIYSYGFSFADVDLLYIRELCKIINTKSIVWMLNDFDGYTKRNSYIRKIQECGFQGTFDTYHIS